jgi:D-3-phosphoglycerate dehydrogenase / 2-oxoglutarate reductase
MCVDRKTIAIVDYDWADLSIEEPLVAEAGLRLVSSHAATEDAVIEAACEADGLVVQYAPITGRVLDALAGCRVISRYGIGVDTVDLAAATRRGIPVCNVPDYCFNEVSDHAVALIMGLIRRVFKANDQVKRGMWTLEGLMPIPSSDRCVVGIVGFGNLGRIVARKMIALGYRCIAADPFVADDIFTEAGVERVALGELLAAADVVTLHAPYTKETLHLIGKKELARMKPSAYLVNTSRGKLVDSRALCEAVRAGRIGGVALDVLEEEPPNVSDPLLSLENVYFTPHLAFYSTESMTRLRTMTVRAVIDVLSGREPHSVVNREVLTGSSLTPPSR